MIPLDCVLTPDFFHGHAISGVHPEPTLFSKVKGQHCFQSRLILGVPTPAGSNHLTKALTLPVTLNLTMRVP